MTMSRAALMWCGDQSTLPPVQRAAVHGPAHADVATAGPERGTDLAQLSGGVDCMCEIFYPAVQVIRWCRQRKHG
jgi:hypothetical protein